MPVPTLLLTAAAAALIAAGAAAQDAPPTPAPEPAAGPATDAEPGLSDLSDTVDELRDEQAPAEDPPETPPPAPGEGAPGEPATPEPAPGEPTTAEPGPSEPATEPAPPERALRPPPPAPEQAPEQAPPPAPEPAPEQALPSAPVPEQAPPPAPPAPAPSNRPPEPLTRAQRAELQTAAQRGRLIGIIAGAGQIATGDMLSRVSDPESAGIAGWIAVPEGNGVTVTFYAEGEGEAPPGAVYRASILGGRVVSRDVFLGASRPPLGRLQARMAGARRAAAGQDHRPCGAEQFNYFVIPPAAADAPIDVYQISPQAARGRYPVGGHFKTQIAADGSIASTRGYTNACLDLAVPDLASGARARPLAITHLLDPMPTEIHAFLAIWTGRPLVVIADDPQRLFAVTGEGIAEVPR